MVKCGVGNIWEESGWGMSGFIGIITCLFGGIGVFALEAIRRASIRRTEKGHDREITALPPKPNDKFMHRKKILKHLRKRIKRNKRHVLISGLGGIGKTTIAKALFHEVKDKYAHIAWIEYQTSIKESLLKAFTLFTEINDPDTRYAEILRFITTAGKNIIIFIDNVAENANDLGFLETLDATVILTSRRKKIGNFEPFPIGFLDEPQCIDIFYKYYDHDKNRKHENIVKTLVNYVKCHTLSVELLAGVANEGGYKLEQFAEDLEKRGFSYFELEIETDHNQNKDRNNKQSTTIAKHLATLFTLSAEKAPKTKRLPTTIAKPLAKLFALFGKKSRKPEGLPEQLRILKNLAILPSVPLPSEIKKWLNCNVNDLQRLVAIGWLTASEDGYYMHPIIKESITLQYGKPSYDDCAEIIDYMQGEEYIKLTAPYAESHFRLSLAEAVMEQFCNVEREEVSTLLNEIALKYKDYGEYDKALHWYEKDRKISEKIHGTDHPITATTYNNIAGVYDNQGKYAEALHWLEKALGTNHPDTAAIYNNIAAIYDSQDKYDEALHWLKKARKIHENALGTDHPDTASVYSNIGGIHVYQGKYDKALHWLEKARKIHEKALGTDHPSTAQTYNNIAVTHYCQGNYAEALTLFVQAYRIRLEKLGENHPHTKNTKENMRKLYTALHGNSPDFDHWLSTQL